MRRLGTVLVVLAALAAVAWICGSRAGEVGAALAAVPLTALAAATSLHLLTLVARSEAWGLALAAVDRRPVPREAVHGANAGAFVCGAAIAHCAMPARIALLKRLAGSHAPGAGQIAVADVPLFTLEVAGVCVLIAVSGLGAWWLAPGALAAAALLLLVARRVADVDGALARGLAVLGDRALRRDLAAWIALLTALGAVRVWLVLSVCGLPHGLGDVALVVAALGVFGLLPLGVSASPGATLAASGSADVAGALAAGLVISASTVVAVLVYAAAAIGPSLGVRPWSSKARNVLNRG